MGRSDCTWRDVWAVAANARPGSPLAAALDPRLAWTRADYMLAAQLDAIHLLLWSLGGGKSGQKPSPLPRPADEQKKDTGSDLLVLTPEDMDAYLAQSWGECPAQK